MNQAWQRKVKNGFGDRGDKDNSQEGTPYTSVSTTVTSCIVFSGNDPFVASCLNYFIDRQLLLLKTVSAITSAQFRKRNGSCQR